MKIGDLSVSVDPEPGVADSGNLEYDLPDMFVAIGQAAKAAGNGWCLLIDEVQYLKSDELAALIVAIHKVAQKQLPVIFLVPGYHNWLACLATQNHMRNDYSPTLK